MKEKIIESLKEIYKLIINKDASIDMITPSTRLQDDLGISSVGLIYFVIAIEEKFSIDMSDATFDTFKTVDDVAKYIEERL